MAVKTSMIFLLIAASIILVACSKQSDTPREYGAIVIDGQTIAYPWKSEDFVEEDFIENDFVDECGDRALSMYYGRNYRLDGIALPHFCRDVEIVFDTRVPEELIVQSVLEYADLVTCFGEPDSFSTEDFLAKVEGLLIEMPDMEVHKDPPYLSFTYQGKKIYLPVKWPAWTPQGRQAGLVWTFKDLAEMGFVVTIVSSERIEIVHRSISS